MTSGFLAKIINIRYKARKQKIEEFINKFYEDNKNKINTMTVVYDDSSDLVEFLESIAYDNRFKLSSDDITKLVVIINHIKNFN